MHTCYVVRRKAVKNIQGQIDSNDQVCYYVDMKQRQDIQFVDLANSVVRV